MRYHQTIARPFKRAGLTGIAVLDLFGEEVPEPRKPAEPAIALDIFDAAARRCALASGRPLSQEHTEIVCGVPDAQTELCERGLHAFVYCIIGTGRGCSNCGALEDG